jgi:hypothetical protein
MQLNENLSLVIPIRRADDNTPLIRGFHTPISREVFEANFRALAATKAALFGPGVKYASDVGPQVAALLLTDEAKREAIRMEQVDNEGAPDISGTLALLAEIKRLTLILAPQQNGWEQLPVDVAIARGVIDGDEWREAESGLVFFTCLFSLCPKRQRAKLIDALAAPIGGSGTSLNITAYLASLATSTPPAPSVLKVA